MPWRVWSLLGFALLYYGSYALAGLDIMGEGGTTAVIAQRLLEGQRPLADTFLGYNVMWFLPIVGLFKIFGPNFTAVRLFFFALCTLTALLGYRAVRRATGNANVAHATGILLVLVPGMLFRNYMGLLGVANLLFLWEAFALPHPTPRRRWWWLAGAALLLGVTFLIRIDLGCFFLVVGLVGAGLHALLGPAPPRARSVNAAIFVASVPVAFLLTHAPVDAYAAKHGVRARFWAQYEYYANFLPARAADLVVGLRPKPAPVAGVRPAAPTGAVPPSTASAPSADRRVRPMPPWRDALFASRGKKRELAFLLYAPVIEALGWAVVAGVALCAALRRPAWRPPALAAALGLGSALTLFPQYLFFRPDPPHLSETMCPWLVLTGFGVAFALRILRRPAGWAVRTVAAGFLLFTLWHLTVYVRYALGRPEMGTVALRRPHAVRFVADNGVVADVSPEEKKELQEAYRLVHRYAGPNDAVICYPYGPTFGFMTNRRSYQWNLYVDNATRPDGFDAAAIAEIERWRPAVIFIDDVAINNVPSSRFSAWAPATLDYIRRRYHYVGTYVRNDAYVRDF